MSRALAGERITLEERITVPLCDAWTVPPSARCSTSFERHLRAENRSERTIASYLQVGIGKTREDWLLFRAYCEVQDHRDEPL